MLGSKKEKTKELLKQIEEKDQLIAEYRAKLEELKKQQDAGTESFAQITAGQAEMDKGLTRVVDCIRSARDNTEEENGLTEEIKVQLKELKEKLQLSEKAVERLSSGAEAEQENLTAVVEENKHFTTPAKNLVSEVTGFKVQLEELRGQLTALKDFFRNMSVMALNAAIEAGRMGESGKKFIAAAENIRNFSEEKEHSMGEILEQIEGLNRRIAGIDEQTGRMNSLLKENNVSMSRIRKEHGKLVQEFSDSGYRENAGAAEEIMEQLAAVKECQKKIWEQENTAMDEIENIGTVFMEEQSAAREAETLFRSVLDACR